MAAQGSLLQCGADSGGDGEVKGRVADAARAPPACARRRPCRGDGLPPLLLLRGWAKPMAMAKWRNESRDGETKAAMMAKRKPRWRNESRDDGETKAAMAKRKPR